MNVSAVRQGIADAIMAYIPADVGLTAYWYVPDSVTIPCFFVKPEEVTYDKTMRRGVDEMTFTVTIYVSTAEDLTAQTHLDSFVSGSGTSSFKAAIESARKQGTGGQLYAGDSCDDVHVISALAYQHYLVGTARTPGTVYLGAQLKLRVIGSGGS